MRVWDLDYFLKAEDKFIDISGNLIQKKAFFCFLLILVLKIYNHNYSVEHLNNRQKTNNEWQVLKCGAAGA